MRRRQVVAVAVAALVAVVFAALVFGAVSETAPTTGEGGIAMPGMTAIAVSSDCCLWQVNKAGSGQRTVTLGAPYRCDTGPTARGATRIRLRFSSAPPCDQNPSLMPNGSILEATGSTLRRGDSLAVFVGSFTIKNPAGDVLFRGTMELLDRVGSHQSPFGSEPCNPQYHQEGWLHGAGAGPLASFRLHAAITGRGPLAATTAAQPLQPVRIAGVLVKCP